MGTTSWSANRSFYIGLAIGQIWLAVISTGFASLLWVAGQNPVQVSLILVGVALVGLLLGGASIALLRSALRLPDDTSPESRTRSRAISRKIGLRFGLIVLAEVVIIGAINIVLGQTNHGAWIVPVTFFVVGLHFIPLAFIFHVRPYIVLGIFWVIINFLTVIFAPARLMLGQGLSAWVFFPIAGCGVATWIVLAYILGTHIKKLQHVARLSMSA